jgi:hypothetical protein
VRASGGGGVVARGIPHPGAGLSKAQGMRGTDILHVDHETSCLKRLGQLVVGLPGLERHVMHRTAALALWGGVDQHSDTYAETNYSGEAYARALHDQTFPSYDPSVTGDPNVIERTTEATPDECNPLRRVRPLPADHLEIHPAQVLTLSYLAHVAMMVTGYRPPFVDTGNSPLPG